MLTVELVRAQLKPAPLVKRISFWISREKFALVTVETTTIWWLTMGCARNALQNVKHAKVKQISVYLVSVINTFITTCV